MPAVIGPAPVAIEPSGEVLPDFQFRGRPAQAEAAQPIKAVLIEVRHLDPKRAGRWTSGWIGVRPDPAPGAFAITNPGQPALPPRQPLQWRVRTRVRAKVLSAWSDWMEFTISQAAPSVTPRHVGTVAEMAGTRLRADVRRPADAASIVKYEIELAERASKDPTRWDAPIWTDTGGPLVARGGPSADGTRAEARIEALEGRAPQQGMIVDRRRPVVRIRTTRPMAAYAWKLLQHGDIIGASEESTANISSDGLCATFRLPNVARRGPGYFAPPFDRKLGLYRGETYKPGNASNPAGHSAYAVDHNRGSAGEDEGDPVLAAAKGRVVELESGKGKVVLSHYGGAFRTEYGHLRVPFEVRLHQEVDALERIGRISNTGVVAFHLHHAHYARLTRGPFKGQFKPTRMRHGGKAVKVSRAGPDIFEPPYLNWKSNFEGFEPGGFRGWTGFDPMAKLRVRVRFTDGSRSKQVELGFFVERRASIEEGAIDAGCRGTGLADERLVIAHRYGGRTLEPGEYSLRYRCTDDRGIVSPWAMDHSLVVSG